MNRIIVLLILTCSLFQLSAQNTSDVNPSDVTACLLKGIELIRSGEYTAAREILKQGEQNATGQDKTKCVYYQGMSYYFEAAEQNMIAEYQSAYTNYGEALKLFRRTNAYKDIYSAALKMGDLNNIKYGYYDLALEQYKYAYDVARSNRLDKAQFESLSLIIDVCGKKRLWSERTEYSIKLDSLISGTTDATLKNEMLLSLGDKAKVNKDYVLAKSYYTNALNGYTGDKYLVYERLRSLAIEEQDYTEALMYGEYCIGEFEKNFADDPKQKYLGYGIQADIYKLNNDRENAFRCIDSLFVSQKYGVNDLTKARQFQMRGRLHAGFNEYDDAIKDYNVAESLLASEKEGAGLDMWLYTIALRAGVYYPMKQYSLSKSDYVLYAESVKSVYGSQSVEYAQALGYLANIEGFNDDHNDGGLHYQEAVKIMLSIAKSDLRYLPSSSRKQYWESISALTWNMSGYGLACGFVQDDFTLANYDALLFSKGLLLASEKTMASMVAESGNEGLKDDYRQLLTLNQQYKSVVAKENHEQAEEINAQATLIDNRITQTINNLGGLPLQDDMTYQDIRSALNDEDVVIDFTDFVISNSRHQYVAYITKRGWSRPKMVPVFHSEQIDSLLSIANRNLDRLYEGKLANDMVEILLKPLLPYIGNGITYFVPSGILHNIAIESIPDSMNISAGLKYHITRLSSAKEVLKSKGNVATKALTSAVLYGGLKYDMAPSDMALEHAKYNQPNLYAVRGLDQTRGDTIFTTLPSSLDEVNEIDRILSSNNVKVTQYTDMIGTEETFMSMSGSSPDVLHIATHGFFYTPREATKISALSGYDDMMYLTGLVMSGGNAEWRGESLPDGALGGLLTSEDISHVDLSNTKMVVLSACETGCGEATNDGQIGLQRAFKKAGVQTLVISLWQVSDLVTKEFMISFYKSLIQLRWNKRAAFEQAQTEIRIKYPEPYYWAGFVMVD